MGCPSPRSSDAVLRLHIPRAFDTPTLSPSRSHGRRQHVLLIIEPLPSPSLHRRAWNLERWRATVICLRTCSKQFVLHTRFVNVWGCGVAAAAVTKHAVLPGSHRLLNRGKFWFLARLGLPPLDHLARLRFVDSVQVVVTVMSLAQQIRVIS